MWIRKFFLILAMISMAFPAPEHVQHVQISSHPKQLLDRFVHLERAITDRAYMDTLSEEEIWEAFNSVAVLLRKTSSAPLEELLQDEQEAREEIAEYLQTRKPDLSAKINFGAFFKNANVVTLGVPQSNIGHAFKKTGKWLWKHKWVIITIIIVAVLAYFGVKAYQNNKVSAEGTSGSPSDKTNIAKGVEKLLPKAQKELQKELEQKLKTSLEELEEPTPEKQAQSIAKTTLEWATNTWIQCQQLSRDVANQFCHEVLDHAAPVAELAAIVADQLKKELSTIFAHTMRDYGNGNTASQNVEELTSFLRNAIDEMLASKRTIPYQRAADDPLSKLIDPHLVYLLQPNIGIIPFSPYGPPGSKEAAKAAKQANNLLRKQIKAQKKALHVKKCIQTTTDNRLNRIVSQSESAVYKIAIQRNKHVNMVKAYLSKPSKEIQKSIRSYEKQIFIHKNKIVNPANHYPNWNKLDPRQRSALVNKKWPTEIKGFEEQKDLLQSILKERLLQNE